MQSYCPSALVKNNFHDDPALSFKMSSRLSEFMDYLFLVIKEKKYLLLFHAFLVKLFSKESYFILFKRNKEIIGGFIISDFPIVKYGPKNFFNALAKIEIQELVIKNYLYCSSLFVKKNFRKGYALSILKSYFKINPAKAFFVPSTLKMQKFCMRNGALFHPKEKYDILIFDPA